MNLVAESTTMSAPHSMGRAKDGGRGGIVDDQGHALLVSDAGQLLDVGNVELGIAQGLGVDGPGFRVDGSSQAVEVVGIGKAHLNAEPRQGVVEKVVGAAVERGGGDDFVAGAGQGEDGQGLGGLAGGGGQGRRSSFEGGDALLEDVGGGVHDAGVDVAEFLQAKEPGGMIGVFEDVRGGLVDGDGARSRGGVRFLPGMHG